MNKNLLCLVPFLMVLVTGCLKSTTAVQQQGTPSGKFTGQFRYLHRHSNAVPFDTVKTNLTIRFGSPANTYAVTGDTSTIHAGSKGGFSVGSPYMVFIDSTFSTSASVAKKHLAGAYLYYYDGTVLQLLAYSADTLSLQYDLKRTQ
jgi:hypothetical protein